MEPGGQINKVQHDSDERQSLFHYYDMQTGEQRSENTVLQVLASGVSDETTDPRGSASAQNHAYGSRVNQCMSVNVEDKGRMECQRNGTYTAKEEVVRGDDAGDVNEKKLHSNDVDDKLCESVDRSVATTVTEMRTGMEVAQSVQSQVKSYTSVHPCRSCGKTFTWKTMFNFHPEINAGIEPSECSHCRRKTFTRENELNARVGKRVDEKPFVCSFCDEAFSTKMELKTHHKIHNSGKPFKCSYCDKAYAEKRSRDAHLRIHTGEKLHYCWHCERGFTARRLLDSHVRTHTDERFECSLCDKAFCSKVNLNRHLIMHTDENPFRCSYCNKPFSDKTALERHLRTHTGEKPFKCSYCDKAFSEKGSFQRHLRRHTGEKPFKCSFCDKALADNASLNRHVLTHTGEKPHKCSHCGKAFTEKGSLKRHLRIHTGEKPHECSQCGRAFADISALGRHVRSHTGPTNTQQSNTDPLDL